MEPKKKEVSDTYEPEQDQLSESEWTEAYGNSGLTISECREWDCKCRGCKKCTITIFTHAFGYPINYCPLTGKKIVTNKRYISYYHPGSGQSQYEKLFTAIEQMDMTKKDIPFFKTEEGTVDKKDVERSEFVCDDCHVRATNMIVSNSKVSCAMDDGMMTATYIGVCPKCGKKYKFKEVFKYMGIEKEEEHD